MRSLDRINISIRITQSRNNDKTAHEKFISKTKFDPIAKSKGKDM